MSDDDKAPDSQESTRTKVKLGELRGFVEAVNGACTCGGAGPGEGCPACDVYHAVKDMEVGKL